MKLLVHSRFIRTLAAAGLLSALFFAGYAVFKHSTARACVGNHTVSHSSTSIIDGPDGSITATLTLGFNDCTGNNYGIINITSGTATHHGIIRVNRASGPDGGATHEDTTNCPLTGTCTSPNVYSPDNLAQACWFDEVSPATTMICTDWF